MAVIGVSQPKYAVYTNNGATISYGEVKSLGKATEVSIESMPASMEADSTTHQLTSSSTALVPMVATAVWAIVFTARIPAALSHFLKSCPIIVYPPSAGAAAR